MKANSIINENITQADLDQLEIYADRLFAKVGIDVEFTRHFLDRVNDERNQKDITIGELTRLFKQEFKKWGKPIAQLGPDAEAVMKDMQTDINLPFVLKWDKNNDELDLVAKTVMRKKNFYTPDKEFPVENVTELKIHKPDPKDTKGITRNKMPQVKKDDYPEFVEYLRDNGAKFAKEVVNPKSLKPIQSEFSDSGVIKALELEKIEKPIIASQDNYIIDGHHRWLAALNTGQQVSIFRVNIPGDTLLQLTLDFPKTYFKAIEENFNESNPFTDARMNAIKAGKTSFKVGGKTYKVTGDTSDELNAQTENFASDAQRKAAFASGYDPTKKKKNETTVAGGVASTGGGWDQDATAQSGGWQGMTKSMRGSFNPSSNKNKSKSSWVGNMLQRAKDTVFGEDMTVISVDQLDAPTLSVFAIAKKHDVSIRQIQDQLAKGVKVEIEHTSDAKVAKEIALDHLAEVPDYYDRLSFVETAGVGKIVKGVNTTVDVGTNEIQKQAKKWGFSVDKDGRPGLLMNASNNIGKKNSKERKTS